MSRSVKFIYFIVALLVMACLAVGSVMMADQRPALAGVLLVVGILLAGAGFALKGRFVRR